MAWDLAKGWTVHQIPSSLPPLFSGDRLVVFGVLKAPENANEGGENEVRLEAVLEKGEKIEHLMKFPTPRIDVENKGNVLLHQLAAKSFIQEKQDDHSERHDSGQEFETTKTSIISISKSANVVSKFTSFVAVDQDSNQPVSGPLGKQFVPLSTSGYQSLSLQGARFHCEQSASFDLFCTPRRAKKKGGFGFGSSKAKKKSSSTQKAKSKGLFSSLFSSSTPPTDARFTVADMAIANGDTMVNEFHGDMEEVQYLTRPGNMSQEKKESPAAMSVISLQKASGSWDLTDNLVSLCGTSRDALIKGCPKEIAVDTSEGKLLWATALALVLLMGKFADQKDEWEMIAEKGTKWMKKNLPAGVKYENVLEAAATTVGVQINLGQ